MLTIPFGFDLTAGELNALDSVFGSQSSGDVSFDVRGNKVIVHLRSLDFPAFKSDVATYSAGDVFGDHVNGNAKAVLDAVLNAVENVKSYGIKGNKRVYAGYNSERKVANREKKEEKREQYFYAAENTFDQKNHPLPQDKIDIILCADSQFTLTEYPDNCIDLVFTSPPYNFGLEYSANDDDHQWEHYFDKLFSIFDECIRVLKYGGRIVVNVQPLFSDYIPTHHIISNYFIGKKLIWKGEILWEKNNYNCKYTAWGSWKSPSNPYLKYTWEFLEVFAKGTLKKDGASADADITADEFKKWVVSKWSIAPERNMKEYDHPAVFPEELAVRVMKMFSFRNDIVLDPFNGSGTTTAVAKKLGRHYIGVDISEKYCETAERRLQAIFL
jgi:DNA modification methylase